MTGLAYDVYKDTFKIYADGVKVESGSWSENPNVIKIGRKNLFLTIGSFLSKLRILVESPRPQKVLLIQCLNQGFFFSLM